GGGPTSSFHHFSQKDQLSQVIGVVVRDQQGLAEQGLSLAVREFRKQVGPGIGDQFLHLLKILLKLLNAFFPGLFARRRFGSGPVVVGKLLVRVFGIAAEIENILLRNAHVFEQLPGRVRRARGLLAAQRDRKTGHG